MSFCGRTSSLLPTSKIKISKRFQHTHTHTPNSLIFHMFSMRTRAHTNYRTHSLFFFAPPCCCQLISMVVAIVYITVTISVHFYLFVCLFVCLIDDFQPLNKRYLHSQTSSRSHVHVNFIFDCNIPSCCCRYRIGILRAISNGYCTVLIQYSI